MHSNFRALIAAALIAPAIAVAAQQVTKEEVPGIRNLSRLETTVALRRRHRSRRDPERQEDGIRVDDQPSPGVRARSERPAG